MRVFLLGNEPAEPLLRVGVELPIPATPFKGQTTGVQGVARQDEPPALFVSEAALDQREVAVFVVPVQFVADDRMPEVREMNPDLVLAPGLRSNSQ